MKLMSRKVSRLEKFFAFADAFLAVMLLTFVQLRSYAIEESTDVKFELNGEAAIILSTEEEFIDPGVRAEYCVLGKCENIAEKVKIVSPNQSELAAHQPGEYQVDYNLTVRGETYQKVRRIKIRDDIKPEIELNGGAVGLYVGREYVEPGFSASDNFDGDITNLVSVEGGVDTSNAGVYTLKYRVADAAGNTAEAERHVFVYKEWYTFDPTPTETFEDLENYIQAHGWDISFGYVSLTSDKNYTYQGDKIYYGASLVKTVDAMYAYENFSPDAGLQSLVRNAITYSDNSAHIALVSRFGKENLKTYAENIGMNYHLKGSVIYGDTDMFCDTTINDQLAAWQHLWELINNNPRGEELKWYFINNFWDNLSFSGSPTHMYKNGLYANNYHEVGIMFAENPYIVAFLSTEGWRWNSTIIIKDLSHRVFMINQL